MNIIRKEFEDNILVTILEKEVRIWVCNNREGNIFRFKAVGKVYKSDSDITIMTNILKE